MAVPTDKTPQEIKREKLRQQFQAATGISFPEGDVFGLMMATKLNDAIRTGARTINPDNEDSPIHCNAEWHFSRYTGLGAKWAPVLYSISWHLSKDTRVFCLSLENLARFLNLKKADDIREAADMLVADGWWLVIEKEKGLPVKYRPVGHEEWEQKNPNRCTKKIEINWVQDDPELAKLGKNLYAILGGEKFHRNILLGVRNAAIGLADDEICAHGKKFLELDKGKGKGKARRARFIEYLKGLKREEPF
ncbi:MAG: hypothetical protein WB729_06695 [Candidatus Sulfotelmatobacter sp.]